jgi:tryptophanyl-tRNA synthetase
VLPLGRATDILSVRADAAQVGKDNRAHIKVAREIARHFNRL